MLAWKSSATNRVHIDLSDRYTTHIVRKVVCKVKGRRRHTLVRAVGLLRMPALWNTFSTVHLYCKRKNNAHTTTKTATASNICIHT